MDCRWSTAQTPERAAAWSSASPPGNLSAPIQDAAATIPGATPSAKTQSALQSRANSKAATPGPGPKSAASTAAAAEPSAPGKAFLRWPTTETPPERQESNQARKGSQAPARACHFKSNF